MVSSCFLPLDIWLLLGVSNGLSWRADISCRNFVGSRDPRWMEPNPRMKLESLCEQRSRGKRGGLNLDVFHGSQLTSSIKSFWDPLIPASSLQRPQHDSCRRPYVPGYFINECCQNIVALQSIISNPPQISTWFFWVSVERREKSLVSQPGSRQASKRKLKPSLQSADPRETLPWPRGWVFHMIVKFSTMECTRFRRDRYEDYPRSHQAEQFISRMASSQPRLGIFELFFERSNPKPLKKLCRFLCI